MAKKRRLQWSSSPSASQSKINTIVCPGGKERLHRLIEVVAVGRIDTRSLVTHGLKHDEIEAVTIMP